jgi:hypothetical protein
LAANPEAKESVLHIFADGPPADASEDLLERVSRVRQIIQSRQWCRHVTIHESKINKGLASSIIDGVTMLCELFGRAIVFEDDIIPTHGCLEYFNTALNIYENERRVMQVSAYIPPTGRKLPMTGFFRATNSWGWATWQRAWVHYRDDVMALHCELTANDLLDYFNVCPAGSRLNELESNLNGKIRTWAVRWYASCLLQNGLTLYPHRSLVKNIGFDGTGTNCSSKFTKLYNGRTTYQVHVAPIPIVEDSLYLACFEDFFQSQKLAWCSQSFMERLKKRISQYLK